MSCEHTTRTELNAYADDQLARREQGWWDEHLRDCVECREELTRLRGMRAALRRHLPALEATTDFREDLRDALRVEGLRLEAHDGAAPRERATGRATLPRAWQAGIVAFLVLATGFAVGRAGRPANAGDDMASQVIDGHLRSLALDHLVDVASPEPGVLKPWFAGKIDFSPPVPDLAADSFPLLGARVDYLGGRSVAALVYTRGPHRINVFVRSGGAAGCARDPLTAEQGLDVLHGRAAGTEFWAVSDLGARELARFAARWEAGAAPGVAGCG